MSLSTVSLLLALCGECGGVPNDAAAARPIIDQLVVQVTPSSLQLRVLVDGVVRLPLWQRRLLYGSREVYVLTLPPALETRAMPDLPLCLYGVDGDLHASFSSPRLASLVATHRGLEPSSIFVQCFL